MLFYYQKERYVKRLCAYVVRNSKAIDVFQAMKGGAKLNNPDTASFSREQLIELLTENLVTLRAKSEMKQSELAERIGIGRQTLLSIENRKSKMRWDTFLAICMIFTDHPDTLPYMRFLGLDLTSLKSNISVKGGISLKFDKLWTDYESEYNTVRSVCALPLGLKDSVCPKCGSKAMTGALITSTADESDPNILCKECGYWRD